MKQELHPSTQILKRNLEQLKDKTLAINPPEFACLEVMTEQLNKKDLVVSCQDFGLFTEAQKAGYSSYFETHHVSKTSYQSVVVFLPKSDAEIEMVLAWASECLSKMGQLILIGQNNAGIKSAKKTLEKFIGSITFSDNARHSAFYVANKTIKLKKFNLNDYWQSFEVALPSIQALSTSLLSPSGGDVAPRGREGVFNGQASFTSHSFLAYSLPGTFSHGKLDEGTKLLLDALPTLEQLPQVKSVLDWGCGVGVLGTYLALIQPSIRVDMVDTNALAIASAEKTTKENKLINCQVFPSYIFASIKEKYDLIISNPPFHKGHDTSYTDSETFIKSSKQYLNEHGHIIIVANIFLRYESLLEASYGYVKTISKTNKYKLLEAINEPIQKPRREKRHRPKRTLEEAGFVDINDLDKLVVQDTENFDD